MHDEQSTAVETLKPFSGKVVTSDTFPSQLVLDSEAQQYVTPSQKDTMKYFLAYEDDTVAGFAVCQFPKEGTSTPEFTYRFVFPEYRRRGVGQVLRNEVYKWLSTHEHSAVCSGINRVMRILEDGRAIPNLASSEDGGWKSYMSMTRTAGDVPVSHEVTVVTIDESGYVDLTLQTNMHSSEPHLLPPTPEGLLEYLQKSGVLPPQMSVQELLQAAKAETVVSFAEGKQLSFQEWLAKLRTR